MRESKWVRMVVYECATDLWFARAFREFVRETTPLDRPLGVLFFLTPPPKTGLDSLDTTISLGRHRAEVSGPHPLFVTGWRLNVSCILHRLLAQGGGTHEKYLAADGILSIWSRKSAGCT